MPKRSVRLAALILAGLITLGLVAHHSPVSPSTGLAMAAAPAEVIDRAPTSTTSTTVAPAPTVPPSTQPKPRPPHTWPVNAATDAIRAHFADVYDQAVAVADCESSLNPNAVGGVNFGLFQISTVHRDDFEQFTGQPWNPGIFDPDSNAAYARKLYDGNGWGPWACRWAA